VELHGGTVRAHSDGTGAGSEFAVILPLLAGATSADLDCVAATGHARVCGHILIVDDNREAADSLAALLREIGAETSVAYGGEEAVAIATSVRPTVGILDIGMPGMDGCELARRLRSDPELESVVLVALTGWGQSEDRARVTEAGFDHHLLKPVTIDKLLALLPKAAPIDQAQPGAILAQRKA